MGNGVQFCVTGVHIDDIKNERTDMVQLGGNSRLRKNHVTIREVTDAFKTHIRALTHEIKNLEKDGVNIKFVVFAGDLNSRTMEFNTEDDTGAFPVCTDEQYAE